MKFWHKRRRTSNDIKFKLFLQTQFQCQFSDVSNRMMFLLVKSFAKHLRVSVTLQCKQLLPHSDRLKSRLLHSRPTHTLLSSNSAVNVAAWDHFKIPPRLPRPLTSSCYRQCSRTELPLYIQPFNRTKGKEGDKKGVKEEKSRRGKLRENLFLLHSFPFSTPTVHQRSPWIKLYLRFAFHLFIFANISSHCMLLLRMLSASEKVMTDLFITHPYKVNSLSLMERANWMSLLVFQTRRNDPGNP